MDVFLIIMRVAVVVMVVFALGEPLVTGKIHLRGGKWVITVVAILACLVVSSVSAEIDGSNSLGIDFTNSADAKAKATWSDPDRVTTFTNGLGWDGEAASSRDGWIQTIPLALGLSWRPPYVISVRVSIYPKPEEIVYNSGYKRTPDVGDVYVRYSPDAKHWSTWQVLQSREPQNNTEKRNPGRHFSGSIRVPYSEQEEYRKLIADYARLDVPWKSDEDAAVRWILETQPDFFTKHLPFIGYVEFLYEGSFYGGQRITLFNAEVRYGMGGIHSPPKDKDTYTYRHACPWSFRADDKERKTDPSVGGVGKPALQP